MTEKRRDPPAAPPQSELFGGAVSVASAGGVVGGFTRPSSIVWSVQVRATTSVIAGIVSADYRGNGLPLMQALMDGREEQKLTLDAREGATRFYERLGFARADSVYVRPRRR